MNAGVPAVEKGLSLTSVVEALETHSANQNQVKELIGFDRLILDHCIQAILNLQARLVANERVQLSSRLLPETTIIELRSIRKHDSMRPQYAHMYNQCLVLSVSYFISALRSVFVRAVDHACCCCPELLLASKEDIRFTFEELREREFNLTDHLGELIVLKKDLSFQNMQHALKAFKDFLGVEIETNPELDTVIYGLAARHVIVHNLAKVDERFMALVKHAPQRKMGQGVVVGSDLNFQPDDVLVVQDCMRATLYALAKGVDERIQATSD